MDSVGWRGKDVAQCNGFFVQEWLVSTMMMLFQQVRSQWLSLAGLVFLLLITAGHSVTARALVDTGQLYEVWVPVADQTKNNRQAAFQKAFEQVMKKLTGRSDVMQLAGVSEARSQIGKLVSQFNYREQAEADRAQPWHQYLLQVRFNEAALNRLLRDNRLPLWGGDRPPVLAWIAFENMGQRQIVAPQDEFVLRDDLNLAAEAWGLPLIFPLMDFEDSGALSVSELWGLFEEPVLRASARYGANAVLAMQVWPVGDNRWTGRSLFLFQGRVISTSYSGMSSAELSEKAIANIARTLSDVYGVAVGTSPDRPIRIQVGNVSGVDSYAKLMRYLDNLTAVRSVTPVVVKGTDITLEVTIDGTLQQLEAAIELGRRLAPVPAILPEINEASGVVGQPAMQADLNYRWR
ncbi:DUF2066 domain-containing protein [Parendozoicomonas haliclonae]|uniref:DUF2066 domain-containing protein n=2 Tax=Parendozoicomonas haliclonae TaxID=1960125 RepID=A0A1X7APT2_9GAMM|nr:hypothetical protein EHSB41UT_03899 [Parendozoicomonas haliclonae]